LYVSNINLGEKIAMAEEFTIYGVYNRRTADVLVKAQSFILANQTSRSKNNRRRTNEMDSNDRYLWKNFHMVHPHPLCIESNNCNIPDESHAAPIMKVGSADAIKGVTSEKRKEVTSNMASQRKSSALHDWILPPAPVEDRR